jgi:hypothetical protein
MAIEIEQVSYGGWSGCCRLSNGAIELIVTTDVGPRVIRFAFLGDENEFKEYPEMLGQVGGDEWRIYGGHRLWHSPEAFPRTYAPDNAEVQLEALGSAVRLVQTTEPTTGIQKEMDILLSSRQAHVQVTHRLRNKNLSPVELAPWALSVMAPGGMAIFPLPPRGEHAENLNPVNTIALWAYTDMSDHRWTWGHRYVLLQQDPHAPAPQKAGALVPDGWIAYARNGHLFVKRFRHVKGARYPDLGCSVAVWTDPQMLELETMGPLVTLEPGGAVEHVEHWLLFRDVPMPKDEAEVDLHVLPKVRVAARAVRQRAEA